MNSLRQNNYTIQQPILSSIIYRLWNTDYVASKARYAPAVRG